MTGFAPLKTNHTVRPAGDPDEQNDDGPDVRPGGPLAPAVERYPAGTGEDDGSGGGPQERLVLDAVGREVLETGSADCFRHHALIITASTAAPANGVSRPRISSAPPATSPTAPATARARA